MRIAPESAHHRPIRPYFLSSTTTMPPKPRKFETPEYISDLIASTYSANYNPRNIENDCYTAYTQTMAELVKKVSTSAGGTMSARQQHNFWLTRAAVDPLDLPRNEGAAAYPDGYSDTEAGKYWPLHTYMEADHRHYKL